MSRPMPFIPPLSADEVESAIPGVKVLEELGAGGQGVTFKVDNGRGGLGALKIYTTKTEVVRVDLEIEKLQNIRCPHVVTLQRHGNAELRGESLKFAELELIEGSSVTDSVGQVGEGELARLIHDVSKGIDCLWDIRVVHRDLKPDNIIRRNSGGYVIIDLGLARHLDAESITAFGYTCGTPGYMSPEQALGRRQLTFRSDLFSLGIVAYELASGRHPYKRNQFYIDSNFRPAPLHSVSSISVNTSDLVMQLLDHDALRRGRSPAEVWSKALGQ